MIAYLGYFMSLTPQPSLWEIIMLWNMNSQMFLNIGNTNEDFNFRHI